MSNYFAGVTDIKTLRKRYRELLKNIISITAVVFQKCNL